MRQGAVIYAKNKRRVSTFYQAVLGLEPVDTQSSHDLLRGNGIELVIHAIPRKYSGDIHIGRPPAVREDASIKPAFQVANLDAARIAAKRTGGFLQPAERAWSMGGMMVLDGWDPEGNVIQFRQAMP